MRSVQNHSGLSCLSKLLNVTRKLRTASGRQTKDKHGHVVTSAICRKRYSKSVSIIRPAAHGLLAARGFFSFWKIRLDDMRSRVLTIYMENPEIPVKTSNGTHHSIWSTSEVMGFWSM